jgi:hypothetical protein
VQQRNFIAIHPEGIEWLFSTAENRDDFLYVRTRLGIHGGTKRSRLSERREKSKRKKEEKG